MDFQLISGCPIAFKTAANAQRLLAVSNLLQIRLSAERRRQRPIQPLNQQNSTKNSKFLSEKVVKSEFLFSKLHLKLFFQGCGFVTFDKASATEDAITQYDIMVEGVTEETMLQAKYSKLRKKKKQVAAAKNPDAEKNASAEVTQKAILNKGATSAKDSGTIVPNCPNWKIGIGIIQFQHFGKNCDSATRPSSLHRRRTAASTHHQYCGKRQRRWIFN